MIEEVKSLGQVKCMFCQMGDLHGSNRLLNGFIKTRRLKQKTPDVIVADEVGDGMWFFPHPLTFFLPD